MYCAHCGKDIAGVNGKFCPYCGAEVSAIPPAVAVIEDVKVGTARRFKLAHMIIAVLATIVVCAIVVSVSFTQSSGPVRTSEYQTGFNIMATTDDSTVTAFIDVADLINEVELFWPSPALQNNSEFWQGDTRQAWIEYWEDWAEHWAEHWQGWSDDWQDYWEAWYDEWQGFWEDLSMPLITVN